MKTNRKILVAGASGVVGRDLIFRAINAGWSVSVLSRGPNFKNISNDVKHIEWDPQRVLHSDTERQRLSESIEGTDYIVNLAGSSIADGRWTQKKKRNIVKSRLDSVRALACAAILCKNPPSAWFQASAIGYYGERGDALLTESDPPGDFFLSGVCQKWEEAAVEELKTSSGIRILVGRIGLVLAKEAPAWKKMVLPVRLGVGGALGSGRQWISWIDAEDLSRAILHIYENAKTSETFNLSAPEPIRQIDLVRSCAKLLHRPSIFPVPALILRVMLGDMANELLLASTRVFPKNLSDLGFQFKQKDIQNELEKLLL